MIARASGFAETRQRLGELVAVIAGRPAAATAERDLSGSWTSNLGKVRFRQAGDRVSGTLTFANGVVANLEGTMKDGTYTFRWRIPDTPVQGTGKLALSTKGNELTGTYQDTSQGTEGPFTMTRDNVPPRIPVVAPEPRVATTTPATVDQSATALPAEPQKTGRDDLLFSKAKTGSPGQPFPSVKITRVAPAPDVP